MSSIHDLIKNILNIDEEISRNYKGIEFSQKALEEQYILYSNNNFNKIILGPSIIIILLNCFKVINQIITVGIDILLGFSFLFLIVDFLLLFLFLYFYYKYKNDKKTKNYLRILLYIRAINLLVNFIISVIFRTFSDNEDITFIYLKEIYWVSFLKYFIYSFLLSDNIFIAISLQLTSFFTILFIYIYSHAYFSNIPDSILTSLNFSNQTIFKNNTDNYLNNSNIGEGVIYYNQLLLFIKKSINLIDIVFDAIIFIGAYYLKRYLNVIFRESYLEKFKFKYFFKYCNELICGLNGYHVSFLNLKMAYMSDNLKNFLNKKYLKIYLEADKHMINKNTQNDIFNHVANNESLSYNLNVIKSHNLCETSNLNKNSNLNSDKNKSKNLDKKNNSDKYSYKEDTTVLLDFLKNLKSSVDDNPNLFERITLLNKNNINYNRIRYSENEYSSKYNSKHNTGLLKTTLNMKTSTTKANLNKSTKTNYCDVTVKNTFIKNDNNKDNSISDACLENRNSNNAKYDDLRVKQELNKSNNSKLNNQNYFPYFNDINETNKNLISLPIGEIEKSLNNDFIFNRKFENNHNNPINLNENLVNINDNSKTVNSDYNRKISSKMEYTSSNKFALKNINNINNINNNNINNSINRFNEVNENSNIKMISLNEKNYTKNNISEEEQRTHKKKGKLFLNYFNDNVKLSNRQFTSSVSFSSGLKDELENEKNYQSQLINRLDQENIYFDNKNIIAENKIKSPPNNNLGLSDYNNISEFDNQNLHMKKKLRKSKTYINKYSYVKPNESYSNFDNKEKAKIESKFISETYNKRRIKTKNSNKSLNKKEKFLSKKFRKLGEYYIEWKQKKKYFTIFYRKVNDVLDIYFYDYTKVKEAENIASENKIKHIILSKIAHEFKTPLNSILGLVNNLKNLSKNYVVNQELNIIQALSNYTIYLISDIIQYASNDTSTPYKNESLMPSNLSNNKNSKFNNESESINNQNLSSMKLTNVKNDFRIKTDLNVFIRKIDIKKSLFFCFDILNALLSCYENKREFIKAELFIEDKLNYFIIQNDEIRINQIIINFISNAVKFTKRGKIAIIANFIKKIYNFDPNNKAQVKNNQEKFFLKISLVDTGMGILEENQEKIFSEGIKLNVNHDFNQKGSGLGLSICANIIKLLNVNIEYSSKENLGSIFSILLPAIKIGNSNDLNSNNNNNNLRNLNNDIIMNKKKGRKFSIPLRLREKHENPILFDALNLNHKQSFFKGTETNNRFISNSNRDFNNNHKKIRYSLEKNYNNKNKFENFNLHNNNEITERSDIASDTIVYPINRQPKAIFQNTNHSLYDEFMSILNKNNRLNNISSKKPSSIQTSNFNNSSENNINETENKASTLFFINKRFTNNKKDSSRNKLFFFIN